MYTCEPHCVSLWGFSGPDHLRHELVAATLAQRPRPSAIDIGWHRAVADEASEVHATYAPRTGDEGLSRRHDAFGFVVEMSS
jgi:hypothetical protein